MGKSLPTNDDSAEWLRGARILIVEDEYYLAHDLARALAERGAEIVGPVGTVAEAEQLISTNGLDCAILDINLRGDMAFPIADRLEATGIPFVVASGYNAESLPERFADVPRVEKPFDSEQVIAALSRSENQ